MNIAPQLPSIDDLRDVQLQEPLRVYSRNRQLLAEFGEKRRTPVSIDEVPPLMVRAFLAAEDDSFFTHSGVDFPGLASAAIELARTGRKRRGGSTITMQVARNYYLSSEKTYLRKLTEILLAFRIERSLSKNEILELYFNKIYLGQRAYGVQAAARVYYGQNIGELSLARMAMIAALPKAPSRVNPVTDPEAALDRRNYILRRMQQLGYIDEPTYESAIAEPDGASLHKVSAVASARYVAEMVRDEMVKRFGPDAYTSGFEVITTIDPARQAAANVALRNGLQAYTRRHGYRGPVARVTQQEGDTASRLAMLASYPAVGDLHAALVTAIAEQTATLLLANGMQVTLTWDGLSWARPYKSANRMGAEPKRTADILAVDDIIYINQNDEGDWRLAQVPKVGGALVSLRPQDGAIDALVGGYDFSLSKFNRATQARRQPGSSFKPVIYSAALEKGFTPASMINDAPVVFDDPKLESTWRPENYSGKFHGPTRLREALYRSRNLVSIRILRSIGADYAAEHAERFGFQADKLPHDLTLALGSASATPLQMARAYAVFANGGYLVEPYLIQRIHDAAGDVVFSARPLVACGACPATMETISGAGEDALPLARQVLAPQNVWQMSSMMQDVIRRGTGVRAKVLGRTDLAGKTGTTNDQMDGWFCGFNEQVVATAWVGFDAPAPLGRGETGGRSALPVWIDYMAVALKGIPETLRKPPEDMVTVRIDPATGLLAASGQPDAIFETFRKEQVPRQTSDPLSSGISGTDTVIDEQLF
ncbi:MAG: penicillin-binding protein 1A [Gammaproteobacteria bacterium]